MEMYSVKFLLVLLTYFNIREIVAISNTTYAHLKPGSLMNYIVKCLRENKYSWIDCAMLCHASGCEMFSFDQPVCAVCSRDAAFSSWPSESLNSNTTFGNFSKWNSTNKKYMFYHDMAVTISINKDRAMLCIIQK